MARKQQEPPVIKAAKPIEQPITDTLELNFMPYAMSVILSRAIPEIDGFKPAHRKLLYTMYKMGLLTGGRTKSANIVGQTMKLNPHGDQAIYETMVRLTRGNETLLHPFVDSKGNFGKSYSRDMAYAASRYTEVKLDAICAELFGDIDKNTVPFVDNYDGTMKEPTLLPTTFPNLLVTPNTGIAVGMANSVCSFNLKEICAATIAYIQNKDTDLMAAISAPDFSTGGEILFNEDEMSAIYETGRGSFKIRARYRYDKKNSCIEVFEIPYTTTIEAIIDKIVALIKAGKLKEITDVRDETDLNGLKLAIDIRRSADPEAIMQKLFVSTPLLDSFSCNFNILVNGRPKVMGIREILGEWLTFRTDCVRRRTQFDLKKAEEKKHLLDGLSKILLDIDKAIAIIRGTEEDKLVIPNLCAGFGIDEVQAEYIAEIKLRNLNKQYLLNRVNELDSLKDEITKLSDIVKHDAKIHSIIASELKEVMKKHGKSRKTGIVYQLEAPVASPEIFIEDYGLKLFLTEHSYLKKITLASLRASSEQYLKDNDRIVQELETTNKAELLFFSDRQNVYKLKAHEIADCKASAIGEFTANLLGSEEGEKILFVAATTDYAGQILFGFENGKFAKVGMDKYETKTNRKKLVSAFSDKSRLVYADYALEDGDYVAFRGADKAVLFHSSLVPLFTAKNAVGVQVVTLKKNSIMSRVVPAAQFVSADPGYYRTDKIPSTGHFLTERDKAENDMPAQMKLEI